MQMAITFMAVVGGMVLSLAVALLAEELIFGQVFRLFFSQQVWLASPSRSDDPMDNVCVNGWCRNSTGRQNRRSDKRL